MELTDNEINEKVLRIKELHFCKRDEDAFAVLDDLVQEYDLLNINSPFNPIMTILFSNICPHKFYLLVGDVYTNVEEYAKSLEAYKLYHFWAQQVSPHKSLINKSSVILYSYRSYNVFFLEDLINRTITCSPPSEMNDPFDSIATFWSKRDNLEYLSNHRKRSDFFSMSFNYYRIRSFVANQATYETDDRLLENVKMWSHYADSHKGLCVKYKLGQHFIKTEKPYENLENEENKYNVLRLYPMIYKTDFFVKDVKAVDATELVCRKQSLWSDENEVRLISYNPYSEDKWIAEPLKDSTIEEIIFGYRCTNSHKMTIYNIAKDLYPDVKFSEIYIDETKSLYKMMKKEYLPLAKRLDSQ